MDYSEPEGFYLFTAGKQLKSIGQLKLYPQQMLCPVTPFSYYTNAFESRFSVCRWMCVFIVRFPKAHLNDLIGS